MTTSESTCLVQTFFYFTIFIALANIFKKKVLLNNSNTFIYEFNIHYFFGLGAEETETLFLPLARLLAKTLRPFAEAILSLKPCLFLLFLFDG
jgi:hypothetical protein